MRRVALVLLVVAGAMAPASAHLGPHEVSIRNNFYQPDELPIDLGETVTWTAIDGGHTVTADDGSFNFPADGTLEAGQAVQWTAPPEDVTVLYGCRVHESMRGAIVVGKGSPVPPPPIDPIEVRAVPSSTYPTIAAALTALPPRARVELAPGTYVGSLIVNVTAQRGIETDVTIVGLGDDPSDVVISGDGVHDTGIGIVSGGVHLANMTVTNFASTGVFIDAVDGFTLDRIAVAGNGSYGVRTSGARAGRIGHSVATGSPVAGIAIEDCEPCDILVHALRAEGNGAGVAASNAGAVVVRDSIFEHNGVAVVLQTDPSGDAPPQLGSHIAGNLIHGTDDVAFRAASGLQASAGIWIAGGSFNVIEGNLIEGGDWGVLVTGLGWPVANNRIEGNTFAGGGRHLAWDGIGLETCFGGNRGSDGSAALSEPPLIEQLYPCDRPTVGIPYPMVDIALVTGGSRRTSALR